MSVDDNFKTVFEELCIGKELQDDFLRVCENRYKKNWDTFSDEFLI